MPGASNGIALYFICLNADGTAKSVKELSGSSGMGMDGDINKGDPSVGARSVARLTGGNLDGSIWVQIWVQCGRSRWQKGGRALGVRQLASSENANA